MSEASYERQHLSLCAAGMINGDGTTKLSWGCELTVMSPGIVGLALGASEGVVNNESFTFVTIKFNGLSGRTAVVGDTSDVFKTIYITNGGGLIATDIEVALYRSITRSS